MPPPEQRSLTPYPYPTALQRVGKGTGKAAAPAPSLHCRTHFSGSAPAEPLLSSQPQDQIAGAHRCAQVRPSLHQCHIRSASRPRLERTEHDGTLDRHGRGPLHLRRRPSNDVVNGTSRSVILLNCTHYIDAAMRRFIRFIDSPPAASEPEPCAQCQYCHWSSSCEARWVEVDHLSGVANMRSTQARYLRDAGISTMAALASLKGDKIGRAHV